MSSPTPATPRKPTIRPWRKDTAKNSADSLISEEYLDVGTQRTLVSALFVALQAYKIIDLLARRHSTTSGPEFSDLGFVVKYFLIETAFLVVLPVLRIPWLTFTKIVTLVIILLLIIINLLLSISASFSLSAIALGIWKTFFDSELTITGSRIRTKDIFDTNSHLSGRHTVHILPESTALFNPTFRSFCVDDSNQSEVLIPIRFNATDPIFIQLNGYDLATRELTTHNFTKKDIKKYRMPHSPEKLDDPRLSYYAIPVSKPALYRIAKVTDASNLNIRLYRSDVLVSKCPSAFISSGTDTDGSHHCVGDVDVPKISLDGVPPLKVKYSRSIQGQEKTMTVQSSNPLNSTVSYFPTSGKYFFWKDKEPLSWASSQSVDVEMDTVLSTTGDWVYYIDEVEDALGNVVNYTQIYNNRENPGQLYSKSLAYGFQIHPRPQINFKGCSPENPIKLRKGSTAKLPIVINGVDASDGPFKAEFEYAPLEDDSNSKSAFGFSYNFSRLLGSITAQDSGTYKLTELSGNYCKGTVLEPATCLVYVPPEPSIKVNFASVDDKCAGPVGVTADVALAGNPPFVVNYRIIRDNVIIKSEYKRILQTRDKVEFKPTSAGNYRYEFFKLGDEVYKNIELSGPEFSTEQTIRAVASASFVNPDQRRKCCSGDSIDFSASLNGIPPFTLNYEIVHGSSQRKAFTEKEITDNFVHLSTPALKLGGRYTISLISVQDSNGCVTSLNERDIYVDVRRDRPAAAFLPLDGSMEVKTLEGKAIGLPLKLSGEGPWDISYRHTKPDGTTVDKSTTMHRANGELIQINQKGVYSLLSVKDAYCPGDVKDSKSFDVSWIERPQLSLIKSSLLTQVNDNLYERRAICENEEDVLELGVTGKSLFVFLRYTRLLTFFRVFSLHDLL